MTPWPCPYLRGEVELTAEREAHIAARHPELLPAYRQWIGRTLHDPDRVRRSARFGSARLFSRWYAEVGKHVVVVVVSTAQPPRHWIVTAYATRKLAEGDVEWTRS